MKTPLLVLILLAPFHPVALGCDQSDCPSTTSVLANKATAAPVAAKSTATATATPATAPTATPPAEKPRRAPGSRRPAYLFM
jgi:hypothetical protein